MRANNTQGRDIGEKQQRLMPGHHKIWLSKPCPCDLCSFIVWDPPGPGPRGGMGRRAFGWSEFPDEHLGTKHSPKAF